MTGGDARIWAVVGPLLALIFGYRAILRKLKSTATHTNTAAQTGGFAPDELERYARHIMLCEIGGHGQVGLKSARVLVVGAGGLGAPALMYLAAAGVGIIGVIDGDVVDISNLQRQIIHSSQNVGMPKVQSAKIALNALNPHITVLPYHRRLDADTISLISEFDLIMDGSDNFETRYAVNAACVAANKPLISGAITQWEGQISLYHPAAGAPCYACVFPQKPATGLAPSCAEAGVLGPLPGVIGTMMAVEAVKYLLQTGASLTSRLLIYDALYAEVRDIKTAKDPHCTVCGGTI
jgi:molybdopterin/thiamine biosynthesis adenylyltransferase